MSTNENKKAQFKSVRVDKSDETTSCLPSMKKRAMKLF